MKHLFYHISFHKNYINIFYRIVKNSINFMNSNNKFYEKYLKYKNKNIDILKSLQMIGMVGGLPKRNNINATDINNIILEIIKEDTQETIQDDTGENIQMNAPNLENKRKMLRLPSKLSQTQKETLNPTTNFSLNRSKFMDVDVDEKPSGMEDTKMDIEENNSKKRKIMDEIENVSKSSNTEQKKRKNIKLSRSELSDKIQFLIDFAGTINIIEKIIRHYKIKTTVITTSSNTIPENLRNTLIFKTSDNDVGHWIYYSKDGTEFNSYKLGHQKYGSNQLCQSFALLYMLNDHLINNRLNSIYNQLRSGLIDRDYNFEILGDNIEIIVNMWKYFIQMENFKKYFINELKKINNEYIYHNEENRRQTSKIGLIHQITGQINVNVILEKLDEIIDNKSEIAKTV